MSKGHLKRIQNRGQGFCIRCKSRFKENDIVATSTSQRYCYTCATKINLVTGDLNKDLDRKKFILDIIDKITQITKSIYLSDQVTKLATLMIQTAFENVRPLSRNKTGMASAAIFLACKIEFEETSSIEKFLPVSKKMLEINSDLLQKNMKHINLYVMAKTIHETRH